MAREISLLRFEFTKLSAQRYPDFNGEVEIDNKIDIKSIEEKKLVKLKQDALKISFSFNLKYKNLADINLEGELVLRTDSKTHKEILTGWKNKSLESELQTTILNMIIQKASIRAIELEEEMGLPIHINIPKLTLSKKE